MKLALFALIPCMMAIVVAPANAQMAEPKAATSQTARVDLSPFHLVFLAYQGHFRSQGIPSYDALVKAYRWGKLRPQDLVQVAIQANRLPAEALNDVGYLGIVEANLQALDMNP